MDSREDTYSPASSSAVELTDGSLVDELLLPNDDGDELGFGENQHFGDKPY